MTKETARQITAIIAKAHEGYDVELKDVQKTDGEHQAIVIKKQGAKIAPSIYLDNFDGEAPEAVAAQIWDIFVKHTLPADNKVEQEVIELMKDRDEILRRVVPRINCSARAAGFAKEHVSRQFLDLTITYHVPLNSIEGTWCITEEASDMLELCEQEIFTAAMMNLNGDVKVTKLSDMVPIPVEDLPMYIVTNNVGVKGAATILSDVIAELAEELNDSLAILPSSVHEIIAIPQSLVNSNQYLANMVKEVNRTTVASEDFLSDSVYIYDIEKEELRIAG